MLSREDQSGWGKWKSSDCLYLITTSEVCLSETLNPDRSPGAAQWPADLNVVLQLPGVNVIRTGL